MLSDTLVCPLDQVQPLAALVLAKTDGNPFFLKEFLRSLYREELLTFDAQKRRWQWDVADIQTRDFTDNVVELMANRVRMLSQDTQRSLRLAACIGNQFDLQTLAVVAQQGQRETVASLWEAMQTGLVLPLGNSYKLIDQEVQGLTDDVVVDYKFAHDRIQQAAYFLSSEQERQQSHWEIGRYLLQWIPHEERAQRIFDIVNHLNLGLPGAEDRATRDELVELNLMASQRAKLASAYGPALNYSELGIRLLEKEAWNHQYDLILALYNEAAEDALLNGEFERMEELVRVVLGHATSLLDKVQVYKIRLAACSAQNQQREGIQIGLEVLELLGVSLPDQPTQADIAHGLEQTQKILADKTIDDLARLPEMTDPQKLAASEILLNLYHHTFTVAPELYLLVVCQFVRLVVQYGNMPLSARAYGGYGVILCGVTGDIDAGYAYGQLALRLVDRFEAQEIRGSMLMMFNGFMRHWKEHTRETLKPLVEAHQIGLETGDFSFGTMAAFIHCFHAFWTGMNIQKLGEEIGKYTKKFIQLNQEHMRSLMGIYAQGILNLQGKAQDVCRLVGESYDEETMLPLLHEEGNSNALAMVYLNKTIFCFLFRDFDQAWEQARLAEQHLSGIIGCPAVPVFYLYDSLVCLACMSAAEPLRRAEMLEKVAANQEKLQGWAQKAPMNYRHKYYLIEAERARAQEEESAARHYYDQAIDLAREHEYVNEEALACELAAQFYLSLGQTRLAGYYLNDAYYAYVQWGAAAKVKDLEAQYPQFLHRETPSRVPFPSATDSGEHDSNSFDLESVLKASQVISGEIVLDQLLDRLMTVVMENAGAQKGCLILDEEEQLTIEAQKSIDRAHSLISSSLSGRDKSGRCCDYYPVRRTY